MASPTILHVAHAAAWDTAGADYAPVAFAAEGIIHCCLESQLAAICQRFLRGQDELVLLTIRVDSLSCPLKYELSPSLGTAFPHLYGRLNRSAVIHTQRLTVDAAGIPSLFT